MANTILNFHFDYRHTSLSVSVAERDDDDNVNNNIIIQKWMHGISPQSKQTPASTKSKCAQSSADRACLLLKMILTTMLVMTL